MKIIIRLSSGKEIELTQEEYEELMGRAGCYPVYPTYPVNPTYPWDTPVYPWITWV